MAYEPPVAELLYCLKHSAGLVDAAKGARSPGIDGDLVGAFLGKAAKFAGEVLAPFERTGEPGGGGL